MTVKLNDARFSREETTRGWLTEWTAFGDLLRSLSPGDWNAPTRCEGWDVRDVAGHVVGSAVDVAAGQPTRSTADEQAARWRDHSALELADQVEQAIAALQPVAAAIDDEAWEAPSPAPGMTIRLHSRAAASVSTRPSTSSADALLRPVPARAGGAQ